MIRLFLFAGLILAANAFRMRPVVGKVFVCNCAEPDAPDAADFASDEAYERMEETFRNMKEQESAKQESAKKEKEDSSALGALGKKGMDDSNLREAIHESLMDQSISVAINQLISEVSLRENGAPDKPKLTPTEKFQQMYLDLKAEDKNKDKDTDKDKHVEPKDRAAAMLESLFGGEQAKDPFDERNVMMKLKQILKPEDFVGLFKDPTIGDYL